MNYFTGRIALGVAIGVLAIAVAEALAADSGIDVLANRTYIHRDSKTFVRVPLYWGEKDENLPNPYRLRKDISSSVMTVDKIDPRVTVTIIWSKLGGRQWSEIVRTAEDDNLGEEYALLVTVYGKAKVSRPTSLRLGSFDVFKILLDDGPDGPAKSAGAVYLFEAGGPDNRWKVKVRAVYPQIGREDYIKQVEDLIIQFGHVPEKGPGQ